MLVQSGRTSSLVQCGGRLWYPGLMTGGALFGRGFVEKNCLSRHIPRQPVTAGAAYFLVRALERECCTGIVVELSWFPAVVVMASGTGGNTGLRELPAVNILMAVLAFRRRHLEIYAGDAQMGISGLMTGDADGCLVRAEQGKRRGGMIKVRGLLPGNGGVTEFAAAETRCTSPR